MSALYVESSAALAWLLGEPGGEEVLSAINAAESVLTSALTGLEVRRSLVRAQAGGMIAEAVAIRLLGRFEAVSRAWIVMEITPEVLARAAARFPVEPIRSLDAIHLATALEFLRAIEDMQVLSLDGRVADNVEPLGLQRASAGTLGH